MNEGDRPPRTGDARERSFDVVVYGATAGGVMAAVAAAREGASVALVEPGDHVGGMTSGGLGKTDRERQEDLVGGLAGEFHRRVGEHYGQPIAWRFEPHVAERVLLDLVAEAGVETFLGRPLVSVERSGGAIASIATDGSRFRGDVYIDSSYEGDLMAAAGVSYAIGREGRSRYGESLAGRRELLPGPHQFGVPVSPFSDDGTLLPYVRPLESLVAPGEGDALLQPYCFRLCLSEAADRVPIAPPDRYDPARYGLVRNHLAALGDGATLRHFLGIGELPNGKTDVNSDGPVSTNLLGASREYPEADRRRRLEIAEEHRSWAHGLLYFLGHDRSVPASLRHELDRYGLPADEFADTGHWPHQLYVREGRRMTGEYVLTQDDLQRHGDKYDSVGMGGYNIDIREIQWVAADVSRFPDVWKEALTEGYVSVPVAPYAIPYRALLPRADECRNLLVSTCVAASHVAYASLRMEPQFMIMGHAAGIAAAHAVERGVDVQLVGIGELQQALRRQGQVVSLRTPT